MLTQIENKNGIISYDNKLMDQIINDAFIPFKGSYKMLDKIYTTELEGVCVKVVIYLKFGTSINFLSDYVLKNIAGKIENNLELPVKSIILNIAGIYSKKLSRRDITIEYHADAEVTDNRD